MATETQDKAPGVDTLAMEFATLLDVTAERLREMDRKDLACGLPDAARHMRKMAQRGVTEREAVERERAAYARGAQDRMRVETSNVPIFPGVYTACGFHGTSLTAAEKHYPFPRITRPRVVRDPHITSIEWSAREPDCIYGREDGGAWELSRPNVSKSAQRVALWADLLANPTEEVSDA